MESIINMVAQGVGVTILPIGYLDYINTSFTEKTNIYARPAECLRSNCLWQQKAITKANTMFSPLFLHNLS